MGWIKRNLFFVIGGLLTLICLGGAGYFIYQNWTSNSAATDTLNELYGTLQQNANSPQQPGTNNTEIAQDQQKQIQDWIAGARQFFAPIPPIPPGTQIPAEAFAQALRQTIDTLDHEAAVAGVTLPTDFSFSFSAQRSLVKFSGSLDPLASQLGEVKAITEILYAARVNDFDSIQRVRASDDDASQGAQADYLDERPITNDLAVTTPYVITFRTFTPELGKVLVGFATSTNTFVVKSISVQPDSTSQDMTVNQPNPYPQPGYPQPGYPRMAYPQQGYPPNPNMPQYRGGPGMPPPGEQQPGMAPMNKGGLQTVLKEQLLRITLEVEIVRLLPKS